ncbi:MAG: transporter substrate-binding domain-containing protein [Methylocella sp.]
MKRLQISSSLLVALLFASPASADSALDAIRMRGVLRVGTTGDYKPFSFRNSDGSYVGADIVMAQHLAHELNVKLEFVPTTWSALLPDFAARKYDVAMGGVSVLPERAAQGDFSNIVAIDGKRPIARCADKERFTSVEAIDQSDVRVVFNPGASNESFARTHFSHAHLIVQTDNTAIFDEIVEGRADVMVTDGIEVDHQVYIHPQLCPADVTAPFTKVEKAYLLPKDAALVKFVNDWLATEMSSGDWPRILDAALHQK